MKLTQRGDAPAIGWTNNEVAALKAEREKLITAGMEALAREAELRTECKRLRAALEEIVEYNRGDVFSPEGEMARRALEGK
jgi:hypothetical protein